MFDNDFECESSPVFQHATRSVVAEKSTFDLFGGELGVTEPKSCTPFKCSKPSKWLSDDRTVRAERMTDSQATLGDMGHLELLEFQPQVELE